MNEVDEDDDLIDDEDVFPHDLADSNDEDLVNDDYDDDVAVVYSNVSRCSTGSRALTMAVIIMPLHVRYPLVAEGPHNIQFEFNDRGTLMPLGDHASHWSNLLRKIVREFPMHYTSWHKIKPERKAGVIRKIRIESSETREYPSLIQTYYDTHTVNGVWLQDEVRLQYEEMRRLRDLGPNTPSGVPYTEDQIMAMDGDDEPSEDEDADKDEDTDGDEDSSDMLHMAKDLFKNVKEKYGARLQSFLSEKVNLVAGDITCENLGIQDSFMNEQIWREVDIVVNVSASTKFSERYDVALALNTYGAKLLLDYAKKCGNIKLLLHVSTAYVSGEKPGLVLENRYHMGDALNGVNGLDIEQEKRIMEDDKLNMLEVDRNTNDKTITLAMRDLGMRRANHYGWPNTYVFTKALGEMILGHSRGDMPLVILRPTIITSTYKEPFPGWIEGIR
nr:alcohol-forming fatty acyl-CoA reductase-like [Tanacetum cinerariifolium]